MTATVNTSKFNVSDWKPKKKAGKAYSFFVQNQELSDHCH